MRQIGTITREEDAIRFAAYLVTLGIAAHAEDESDVWVIWVRDEDQLDEAKSAISDFKLDPTAAKYQGVEQKAKNLFREEEKKREQVRKNVVHMRGKWGTGTASQRKTFTMALFILCVVVSLFSNFANAERGIGRTIHEQLSFARLTREDVKEDPFYEIRHGEVWRLVTPIFLHGSILHLVFNMLWLFYFGAMIESRRSSLQLALMVLGLAVFTNVVEAMLPSEWGASAHGIGMSGVVYGLFGYIWLKMILSPGEGFYVSQFVIIVFVGYAVLGVTGVLDNSTMGHRVDHWAHGLGLVGGAAIGWISEQVKSPRKP